MKELEKQILAACLHEDKYKEVSFLEDRDFTDYPGNPCRVAWKIISRNKGKDIYKLDALKKLPRELVYWFYNLEYSIIGYKKHLDYSLFLLESRFKSLLCELISQLSIQTKNELEYKLLNEVFLTIPKADIFDLSENLIEYLGHHASDHTKQRINAYNQYIEKRVGEVKKVRNELK